jgi:ADP-ribosylglycohydrolase
MNMEARDYGETFYAGVLGKIIGVYLGRPVEGWPYEDIRARFGEIPFYVAGELGLPLIVADDDISGTFAFVRALEDTDDAKDLTARHIGDTWLNYVIEDKTILWWGGLGRSTEHTAFLRLKAGVPAPRSGSAALNGTTLTEQVGAQIFVDAFAMTQPGDPERAAALVRQAASVSHDGLALEAAAFFGAMEALAFDVSSMLELIAQCRRYISAPFLHRLVDDVVSVCDRESDWRAVRSWLDHRYGYHRFAGPCPIATNHAMVLAALLLGGDSFQRSVTIAASAGWDTDSNAGNVGCLNGIRLGLDAITADVDLRAPVADRLLVVTADGGSCVTDAVQETRRIQRAAARSRGEDGPTNAARFTFEYRGSTQGFAPCPYLAAPYPNVSVGNHDGLLLDLRGVGPGAPAAVSTPVYLDPRDSADNFSTLASPTLYAGQLVQVRVRATGSTSPTLRLYVLHRAADGQIRPCLSDPHQLAAGVNTLAWRVPDTGPNPLIRFGLRVESGRRYDGRLVVEEVDWRGAPDSFEQSGMLLTSIWDTTPEPLSAWVSSARNFEADFRYSYSVSHPAGTGLVTLGTREWDDYAIRSTLAFNLHRRAGLVARSVGHRRYYAATFSQGTTAALVKQDNSDHTILASAGWAYQHDVAYRVELRCAGPRLRLLVDGECLLDATDASHPFLHGGAGFLVEEGTLLADGFHVQAQRRG